MKTKLLAYRYAKAFLELAIQNNIVDAVLHDLLLVKKTIEDNKELNMLMHQPFASKTQKINIISKLFRERVKSITLNLITLLIEKNREDIITKVYEEYHDLYLEHKKIADFKIIIKSCQFLDFLLGLFFKHSLKKFSCFTGTSENKSLTMFHKY